MKIGRYSIDGYVERPGERPLLFEVNGCCWHGCPSCFPNRDKLMPTGNPAKADYSTTQEKGLFLKEHGELRVYWECEIRHQLRTNAVIKEFFEKTEVPENLSPRRALYGGRTGALKLRHNCKDGDSISYVDVVCYASITCNFLII